MRNKSVVALAIALVMGLLGSRLAEGDKQPLLSPYEGRIHIEQKHVWDEGHLVIVHYSDTDAQGYFIQDPAVKQDQWVSKGQYLGDVSPFQIRWGGISMSFFPGWPLY